MVPMVTASEGTPKRTTTAPLKRPSTMHRMTTTGRATSRGRPSCEQAAKMTAPKATMDACETSISPTTTTTMSPRARSPATIV